MAPPLVSWSDLPEDLLELILKQVMDIADLYQCRNTCHLWRSIAKKLLALSPPRLLSKRNLYNNKNHNRIKLLDHFTGNSTFFETPKFKSHDGSYQSSQKMWFFHQSSYIYHRKNQQVLSCIIFNLGLGIYAAWERKFWRPGDKKRIPILRSGFCINSIIHYKDEFYGIDPYPHHSYVNGEIEQFFVQLAFMSSFPGVKRIPTKINRPQYMSTNDASQFLVESLCGNFLLVCKNWIHIDRIWRLEVYKLDWEMSEWEKITSLGDQAIFLEEDSICIQASASTKYKQNCIYFMGRELRHLVALYDMGNQTVSRPPFPLPDFDWRYTSWFRPEI
ncbi:putative F-box protein At5g66830 [Quercus suber]|uniref:putative F-box protein At5g66830 n=1 Tax=Quercus suber TaxID=58331 RepID=UPI0032DF6799